MQVMPMGSSSWLDHHQNIEILSQSIISNNMPVAAIIKTSSNFDSTCHDMRKN